MVDPRPPELAEQLAREGAAEARRRNLIPGRKCLAGDGSHSPRVQVRVPESLRAAAEGVSLSVLAREALECASPLTAASTLRQIVQRPGTTRAERVWTIGLSMRPHGTAEAAMAPSRGDGQLERQPVVTPLGSSTHPAVRALSFAE